MEKSSLAYKWIQLHSNHKCKQCKNVIPVSDWTASRVWSYLCHHKLPIFCSTKCANLYNFPAGKNHVAYKNGNGRGYNTHFREKVILYLGLICSLCKKTTGRLDLHHKDKNSYNNIIENVQVLCSSCHRKIHAKESRKYPSFIYKNKKTYQKYLSQINLKKIRAERLNLYQNIFLKKFGHTNFVRAVDIQKKYNITRERVRQLRKSKKIKYIKIGGIYLYEMPQRKNKRISP